MRGPPNKPLSPCFAGMSRVEADDPDLLVSDGELGEIIVPSLPKILLKADPPAAIDPKLAKC